MGTIPSIDAVLNLSWALVSVATLLLSWRSCSARQHKRALVALLFILVVLFPVISTADDAAVTLIFDPSPSTVMVESGKEVKQVLAPALVATQVGHGLNHSLTAAAGETVVPETPSSSIFLLVSSGPGIHSPPRF